MALLDSKQEVSSGVKGEHKRRPEEALYPSTSVPKVMSSLRKLVGGPYFISGNETISYLFVQHLSTHVREILRYATYDDHLYLLVLVVMSVWEAPLQFPLEPFSTGPELLHGCRFDFD